MQAVLENWFPTQLMLVDAAEILSPARAIFAATNFLDFQDERYLNGYTTFYSNPTQHFMQHPEASIIVNAITDAANALGQSQGVDLQIWRATNIRLWMNRMHAGCSHGRHVHGDAQICGTLYVDAPEGAAAIRFHNPFANIARFCLLPADGKNPASCEYVDHTPAPGKLLLWNGWLEHEVLPNQVQGNRDSISFNVSFERI